MVLLIIETGNGNYKWEAVRWTKGQSNNHRPFLLELGEVRKRPAESGIGFCLPPARAWLYPAPLPGSQSVRNGRPMFRTTKTTEGRKKRENVKFTKFHHGEIHQ